MRLQSIMPVTGWARAYRRDDFRADLAAGLTVGAMLVPQAMAYALLAGLPPEVGLYASIVPVVVYAFFGTSRQLAVGPVAVVSLLTATALAPVVDEGSAGYVAAAALLALMVGIVHIALGVARMGYLVNLLSNSVLVGYMAATAIIIGFSQAKHLLGISVDSNGQFYETVIDLGKNLGHTNGSTLALGLAALALLLAFKRLAPRVPSALVVVIGSIAAVRFLDLESHGVKVVGDIPDALPMFGFPDVTASMAANLMTSAFVITLVGFVQSIAVVKVYARRHHYEVDPNAELVGIGAANVAAGLFGGLPITGGFARSAVNDSAGARTPFASIVSAGVVLATVAFLTPLLTSLPNAALGAIIVMAVLGFVDVAEMRHIAAVKRSDLVGLGVAFVGTLIIGVELGLIVAVVASMLVVFARMSMPHSAVLGRVDETTSYRNIDRFPEVRTIDGIRIVRVDAAISFVNSTTIKKLILAHGDALDSPPRALVVDASGVNDLDATGAEMLSDVLRELEERSVDLHLTDVKGPVRDVLRRAGLWGLLGDRVHTSTHDAVAAITGQRPAPTDQRRYGIDERAGLEPAALTTQTSHGNKETP